jgi:hypothetical protein
MSKRQPKKWTDTDTYVVMLVFVALSFFIIAEAWQNAAPVREGKDVKKR